ncbi:hypothetical protein [Azospirillum palustre]
MNTFAAIIDLWPSAREFAADLGVPPTHVAVWRHRNSIPDYHWADLIEAARRREIDLSLETLAVMAREKRPRRTPSHPEGRAA